MKNVRYGLALAALCSSSMLFSQGVVDALKYSQQDIRGTARYMGMAGAFGALGGDITTLSQNPAGIGVYRNSDIAATIDLSNQVSSVNTAGNRMSDSKFNVSCNNFGFVWTVRFNQEALKNLNFGFAYNKQKSFDRSYKAGYSGITGASSLSGYIAHLSEGYSVADLAYPDNSGSSYDPYNNNPWLNVLGYQSYLINPKSTTGNTWNSIVGNGTNTTGDLYVREKGSIDEYNFNVGGNIYNVFYWGLGIAVTDFSYDIQSGYGENFTGGYISSGSPSVDGWYLMRNALHTNGSGIKVKKEAERELQVLKYGLEQNFNFSTHSIPEEVIDAFVKEIIVYPDCFVWKLNIVDDDLKLQVEGRKNDPTVSLIESPTTGNGSTGCYRR